MTSHHFEQSETARKFPSAVCSISVIKCTVLRYQATLAVYIYRTRNSRNPHSHVLTSRKKNREPSLPKARKREARRCHSHSTYPFPNRKVLISFRYCSTRRPRGLIRKEFAIVRGRPEEYKNIRKKFDISMSPDCLPVAGKLFLSMYKSYGAQDWGRDDA